jgi:hypothetical protein
LPHAAHGAWGDGEEPDEEVKLMIDRWIWMAWPVLLALLVARPPAMAQSRAAPTASDAAAAPDAAPVQADLEDLILLEALGALHLSDTQHDAILPLARGVRDRLRQARGDEARKLLALRETIATNRQHLLAGSSVSTTSQEHLRLALEAASQRRAGAEDDLVRMTSARLAQLLTREQMAVIYSLTRGVRLASTGSDPLSVTSPLLQSRAIAGMLGSPSPDQEYAQRQEWFERHLQAWYERGKERGDLVRELTYGVPPETPQYVQAASQVGAFLDQIKAMPSDAYNQQLNTMLDRFVRANLLARQQAERARFLAAKTPAQQAEWLAPFVRRVFFSPRFVPVLEARAERKSR